MGGDWVLGDGSETCRQSIWLPSEKGCLLLRAGLATGVGNRAGVGGVGYHGTGHASRGFGCVFSRLSLSLRPFIPSHRIAFASIYSIPYLPAVIISQPPLFTDMKNFKKSLVFSTSFSCPSLTPLPSFVQKTQILQKTSPLNRLQHPPLLPLPPLH